jgi:hypothetical protein
MKINQFKKLEKEINGHNFNQSYKGINMIMTALSYFGHVASIFLAYFFMSKIISSAMSDNPVAVFISSVIILCGLELLKRDIFDKFSIQSLREKGITKKVMPLLAMSMLLIFFSFYSTINGAKQFSSKSDQIEKNKKEIVTNFSDSITSEYSNKMLKMEGEIDALKSSRKEYEDELTKRSSENYESYRERKNNDDRKRDLVERIKEKSIEIDKIESVTKSIKVERDDIIKNFEDNLTKEKDSEKKDNSKNSFLFVIISTLIELIILGGVHFNQYYKLRSYREFRDVVEKDPNYQKWLLFDQMLNIVIAEDSKINQKLPSNKSIIDMCKVSGIIVLPKDVTEFLKVLSNLGIIKSSGSVKYISKSKEISEEILRKNFNIE